MFETKRDVVEHNFRLLCDKAKEEMPDLELYLGCEFHQDKLIAHMLAEDERYRMNGTRYVLVEFSEDDSERLIKETCGAVLNAGLYPIIAHAERINIVRKKKEKLVDDLRDEGVYIQINANSILGYDGMAYKWCTRSLLKNDAVDFLGSDAHNMSDRVSHLKECALFLKEKYPKEQVIRLLSKNPKKIVINEKINDV
jgi:protein-tyrosine phosphatase